jgi:hypothetical protein
LLSKGGESEVKERVEAMAVAGNSERVDRAAVRPADVVFCSVADGGVLLSLKQGVYFGVDPIGARIWDLLQTPRTASELVTLLMQEFDVGAEQCRASVTAFLDRMEANELIRYEDRPVAS